MDLCECGAESHLDQIDKFPVGATIRFRTLTGSPFFSKKGIVVEHCDDGRAVISVEGNKDTHTFHYPPFVVIEQPAVKVDSYDPEARISELEENVNMFKSLAHNQAEEVGRLLAENEHLHAAIKAAQDAILFMPTWVEGDSYEAQVDMRKRCYEAVVGILKA